MEKSRLVEAALFMSAEPLTIDQLGKIMETETLGKALGVLDALVLDFNKHDSALEIVKTTDGRYRMQVRSEYLSQVKHLAISTDLPKSVLRTLAIIAFKQPIKQSIVVKMRGNKAYDHIERLREEGFVKKTREGNTYVLETTKKFIDYFGEAVKTTDFVPADRQTILAEAAENVEEAIESAPEEENIEDTPTAEDNTPTPEDGLPTGGPSTDGPPGPLGEEAPSSLGEEAPDSPTEETTETEAEQ